MIAALRRVADAKGIALGPITHRPDPVIAKIVATWPARVDAGAPSNTRRLFEDVWDREPK